MNAEHLFDAVIKGAFEAEFFDGEILNQELRASVPVKLSMALRGAGMTYAQVNALALSVREVVELDANPLNGQALSPKQKSAWDALSNEKALPEIFRRVLGEARARVSTPRDLTVVYGILAGTLEKMNVLNNMAALAAPGTVSKTLW
jgi:hypothetical protein